MTAEADIQQFAAIADRYEVLGLLGTGGFGAVYRAKQRSTSQEVAIKVLHAEKIADAEGKTEAARFDREMELIAKLNHPNIVKLFDAGRLPDGRLYTVLEFVSGEELEDVVQREQGMEPEEALRLMSQVLDALSNAHGHGIIHRDLKPQNIMVTKGSARRNALVLDFGISAIMDSAKAEDYETLTAAGRIHGTPAYMAPEQLMEKPANPQFDLYAWGLTFIKALTARNAVRADSLSGLIFKQVSPEPIEIPPLVTSLPFGEVIRRCVEKDPTKRYTNAKEVLDALDASMKGGMPETTDLPVQSGVHQQRTLAASAEMVKAATSPPNVSPPTPVPDTPEASSNMPMLLGIGALVVAVIVALVFLVVAAGDNGEQSDQKEAESGTDDAPESGAGTGEPEPIPVVPDVTASAQSNSDVAEAPVDTSAEPDETPSAGDHAPSASMLRLDKGNFEMGGRVEQLVAQCQAVVPPELCTSELFASGEPGHLVRMLAFDIDRNEVTNADWKACVADGSCAPLNFRGCGFMNLDGRFDRRLEAAEVAPASAALGALRQPVVCVTQREAAAYCQWADKRLPTEAEWEYAASRGGNHTYPWGDAIAGSGTLANRADSALADAMGWSPDSAPIAYHADLNKTDRFAFTADVGSFVDGGTPDGLMDLAGNVREWTSSAFESYPDSEFDPGEQANRAVTRGGSWADIGPWLSSRVRTPVTPGTRRSDLGFRCVKEIARTK